MGAASEREGAAARLSKVHVAILVQRAPHPAGAQLGRRGRWRVSTHLIAVEQTHRASGIWQIRCACGWTQPFSADEDTRALVRDHQRAASPTPTDTPDAQPPCGENVVD